MNFIKILLAILFSLGGYTEAAVTLKKQVVTCIMHEGNKTVALKSKTNPSIKNRELEPDLVDSYHSHKVKKSKYRTGSKRYKNRTLRIYRSEPMQKWIQLVKNGLVAESEPLIFRFYPEDFIIQRHKNLCVIAPRA